MRFPIYIIASLLCTNLSGNSHLYFTENKGQVIDSEKNLRPDVLFTGQNQNTKFYIRGTGISYVLNKIEGVYEDSKTHKPDTRHALQYTHRIDVDFLNCNKQAETKTENQNSFYTNYYYSHCLGGINHVKSYAKIIRKNIYKNIDVVYYGDNNKGLEYDIIVNPGGDANEIKLKYNGEDELEIVNGELKIKNSLGELTEIIPKVYQKINEKIIDIAAKYVLQDGSVCFVLETYNKSFPLVIDPWITYYGGNDSDWGSSVATDNSANIISVGYCYSANLPTLGAYQTTLSGCTDTYITKMNANGNMIWATYYGGSLDDQGQGIETDNNNDIYISGYTVSDDLPVSAGAGQTCWQNTYAGPGSFFPPLWGDAFILKLNGSGSFIWSTYYGGTGEDFGYDITVDASDNVLLYGYTNSGSDIATSNTFQPNISDPISFDVFVVKFSPTGNRIWGSYCGGRGTQTCGGIVCDYTDNSIYIGGLTSSASFPILNAHQNVSGGNEDAFLFKFDANGGRLWGTYYGGNKTDYALALSIDQSSREVILAGATVSSSQISTTGSYQPSIGGTTDCFVAKFNSSGVQQWGTYIGGTNMDYVTGVDVDSRQNISLIGDTYSNDFPVTSCAFRTSFTGHEDQFITTLTGSGNLICSGYISSGNTHTNDNETANGAGGSSVVSGGFVYFSGYSVGNFPVTPGAYQTQYEGNTDATLAKFCITSCSIYSPEINFSSNDSSICIGSPVDFFLSSSSCDTANTSYQWNFTGATVNSSTSKNPQNITYTTPGTYDVKVVVTTPCGTDSILKTNFITVTGFNASALATDNSNCINANGTISTNITGGTPTFNYIWSNGNTSASLYNIAGGIYSVTITDANSCSATITSTINNPSLPQVNFTFSESTTCHCISFVNTSASNLNYTWSFGDNTSSSSYSPDHCYSAAGNYTTSLVVTDSQGCSNTIGANVVITDVLANASGSTTITRGNSAAINASGGTNYSWSPSTGLSCNSCASAITSPTETTTYTVVVSNNNGCEDYATVTITIEEPCGDLFIPNAFSPNGDGENDIFKIYDNCAHDILLIIYNRWGEKVFETEDITQTWDGTFKGKEENTDVFFYTLTYYKNSEEIKKQQGNITLLK